MSAPDESTVQRIARGMLSVLLTYALAALLALVVSWALGLW